MPDVATASPTALKTGMAKLTRFIAPVVGLIGGAALGWGLGTGSIPDPFKTIWDQISQLTGLSDPVGFGATELIRDVGRALTWVAIFLGISWGISLLGDVFAPIRKALIVAGLVFLPAFFIARFKNISDTSSIETGV